MSKEYDRITKGNEYYETKIARWNFLLESYVGGDMYRKADHLRKFVRENVKEHSARLESVHLDNHCNSVISVYNSFLFREKPDREFGQLKSLPEIQQFIDDADRDGRSLDAFMKDVSTWSSVFGHCWVLLSKPNVNAQTRSDELALDVRPYASIITPTVVLDWAWQRQVNGSYKLSYLRYKEESDVIKEWTPQVINTYIVNNKDQEVLQVINDENQLGFIPAVISYAQKTLDRNEGISDISEIADAQKSIYNYLSDVDEAIKLDVHPTLLAIEEADTGSGPGSVITIPRGLESHEIPSYLESKGIAIDKILDTIEMIVKSIQEKAHISSVKAIETKSLSGVAMETEFQELNAKLSEKADNIELVEENLFDIFGAYYDREFDGSIDYPGSFSIRDTQNEYTQLQTAKGAATDPRVLALVDRKLVELLGEDPDLILSGEPQTTEVSNNGQ